MQRIFRRRPEKLVSKEDCSLLFISGSKVAPTLYAAFGTTADPRNVSVSRHGKLDRVLLWVLQVSITDGRRISKSSVVLWRESVEVRYPHRLLNPKPGTTAVS